MNQPVSQQIGNFSHAAFGERAGLQVLQASLC